MSRVAYLLRNRASILEIENYSIGIERKCLFDPSGVIAWRKQERTINHHHISELALRVRCALAAAGGMRQQSPYQVGGLAREISLQPANPNEARGLGDLNWYPPFVQSGLKCWVGPNLP